MPKKGFAYSKEELDNFRDIIEEVLPISSTAWECVAEVHSSRYPDIGKQRIASSRNSRNYTARGFLPATQIVLLLLFGQSV